MVIHSKRLFRCEKVFFIYLLLNQRPEAPQGRISPLDFTKSPIFWEFTKKNNGVSDRILAHS